MKPSFINSIDSNVHIFPNLYARVQHGNQFYVGPSHYSKYFPYID